MRTNYCFEESRGLRHTAHAPPRRAADHPGAGGGRWLVKGRGKDRRRTSR